MNVSTSEAVKDKLFNENQIFRDLVQKHKSYEKRLAELSELSYPNDEEILEESLLKKKKLLLKDEIFEMIQKHSTDH